MGRVAEYSLINCAVNPQAARERVTAYAPVLRQKKVLIVGGGVAGCEAARVLAIRGHLPVLYEKGSRLGGNLLPGGAPEFKEDDLALARWYADELARLRVPVYLNTVLTRSQILEQDFDALIIATGSTPKVFSLGDDDRVYTAAQVLLGEKDCGRETVVVGGGLVGCETALWLAQHGKKVTIVETLDGLMAANGPLCHANRDMLEALLPFQGVTVVTGAEVKCYRNGVLSLAAAGRGREIPCDSVILAAGMRARTQLADSFMGITPEFDEIGDCVRARTVEWATKEGFYAAIRI